MKIKQSILDDIQYEIIELTKSTPEVDLVKGGKLDKSKLVAKKVPVKGKNGKTYMATRWVRAGEDPSNNTGSSPSSMQGDGILQQGEQYANVSRNKSTDTITQRAKESNKKPTPKAKKDPMEETRNNSLAYTGLMDNPTLYEATTAFNEVVKGDKFKKADASDRMDMLGDTIRKHARNIRKAVGLDIETTDDLFVRNVQKGTLDKEGIRLDLSPKDIQFEDIGTHPDVLKYCVMNVLGEDLYNTMKQGMEKANLTINTYNDHLLSITEKGYEAMTIERYIEQEFRDNPKKAQRKIGDFHDIMDNEELDEEDKKGEITTVIGGEVGYNIVERADAEYNAMTLELYDRKPCYIAFNPDGGDEGGAPEYGDGAVVQVVFQFLCFSYTQLLSSKEY